MAHPRVPKGNMEWSRIPPSACVIEHKTFFEVRDGRKRYVAYWGSQDAYQAQMALKRRAKAGCKR